MADNQLPPPRPAFPDKIWGRAGLLLSALMAVAVIAGGLLIVAPSTQANPDRYAVVDVVDGGSIYGKVLLGSAKPRVKRIRISKDADTCGTGTRDLPLVQANGEALLDTVVYLEDISSGKAFSAAAKKVTVNQLGCRFIPHLTVVENGGLMEVVNSDHVLHNIHAYESTGDRLHSFLNASQPRRGNILTKTIDMRPGATIRLTCDAHDFMLGFVFVASNPYYAIVDGEGRFTLTDVPPGRYRLAVWHGVLGKRVATVEVKAGTESSVEFSY